MIRCLPRETSSPVAVQLSAPLRTDAVNKKARDDFGEMVGSALDTISSMPLIPAPWTDPKTVAKLISCGRLAGKKAGHGYRTTTAALLAYIESGEETKPANAGDQTEDKPCQSSSEMAFGTVISLRHQERELGALLERGIRNKRRSYTTD